MASGTDYGKIVVLTGAGASAALGLPTMQKFRKHIVKAGPPLAEMAARMNGGRGYDNAEQIYSCLDLYVDAAKCAIDGDGNMGDAFASDEKTRALDHQAAKALRQLQDLMLEKWGKVTCAPEGSLQRYRETLDRLYELNEAPLRVFTTNYDIAFESLDDPDPLRVDRLRSVDDGTLVNGLYYVDRLRQYAWDQIKYLPQEMVKAARLVLYRLHGCSFWFQNSLGQIVLRRELPARCGVNPMVVFPGRRKADEAFRWVFTFAYAALREAITSAKLCVVIGSSFCDGGVLDALRLAGHERGSHDPQSTDTQFVIVNCAKDSSDTLRHLGGWRRTLIRANFGEPMVNDCLLSTCERLLRDDPEYNESEVVQVPGIECWKCPGYTRGCSVAVGEPPDPVPGRGPQRLKY